MSDYDLRPCPFCGEKFTTIQDQYGTWSLDHPKNGCLLDNHGLETTYWYSRDVLVDKINSRPIEDALRGMVVDLQYEKFVLRECNRALKSIKEVQNSRRWWQFWRKEDKNA